MKNAARLAQFARAAYSESISVRKRIKDSSLFFEPWQVGNAEGICAANEKVVVLAIAGTNDPADLLNNADFQSITLQRFALDHEFNFFGFGQSKYHLGFLTHAGWVAQNCRKYLGHHDQIFITGHSLGGAAASLMPLLLPRYKPEVYTFGAPKTPRKGSPQSGYDLVRVANIFDPVTMLPGVLYDHQLSTPLYVRYNGGVKTTRNLWTRIKQAAFAGYCLTKPKSAIKAAHSMVGYESQLSPFYK